MRNWSRTAKRWALALLGLLALLGGVASWSGGRRGDWAEVKFVGYSTRNGPPNELALFCVTNRSKHDLYVWSFTEAKSGNKWTCVANKPYQHEPLSKPVRSRAARIFAMRVPAGSQPWRFTMRMDRPLTRWEKMRMDWASALAKKRINLFTKLLWPRGVTQTAHSEEIPPRK